LTVHWQANGDYTFLNDKLEQLRTIDRLAKYYFLTVDRFTGRDVSTLGNA
jgi:hypothetical protein